MRDRLISVGGTLVRVFFLLFGILCVLIGILLALGYKVSTRDDVTDGDAPFSVGLGLTTMGIVAAFSLRKRAAKRRAEAQNTYLQGLRDMLSERLSASLAVVVEPMQNSMIKELNHHMDRSNIADPVQRKELLNAALRGFHMGHKAAIREQVAQTLPKIVHQLAVDEACRNAR